MQETSVRSCARGAVSAALALGVLTGLSGCGIEQAYRRTQIMPDSTNVDLLEAAIGQSHKATPVPALPPACNSKVWTPSMKHPLSICRHVDPQLISDYFAASDSGSRTALRNQIVYASLAIEDQNFIDYTNTIYYGNATTSLASDFALLGLTGAGAVAGSSANAISAAATALTGARTAVAKDLLQSETVPSLILSVVVTRAQLRSQMQTCLALSDDQYSLPAAVFDVAEYHRVTNLPFAIADLTNAATTGSASTSGCDASSGGTAAPPPGNFSINYATATGLGDAAQLTSALVKWIGSEPTLKAAGVSASEAATIPNGSMNLTGGALNYRWTFTSAAAAAVGGAPAPVTFGQTVLLTLSGAATAGDKISLTATPSTGAAASLAVVVKDKEALTDVANDIVTAVNNSSLIRGVTPAPAPASVQNGTINLGSTASGYIWKYSATANATTGAPAGSEKGALTLQVTATGTPAAGQIITVAASQ